MPPSVRIGEAAVRLRDLTINLTLAFVCIFATSVYAAGGKSYRGAITAKELLVLTGACNLSRVPPASPENRLLFQTMCQYGTSLLKLGTVFDQRPRWLWQPGTMRDHPDFLYAGNPHVAPDLPLAPVDGIAMDVSHFYAKWPLFFLAARDAAQPADVAFLDEAIAGLTENLFSRVIDGKPPDGSCVIRYRTFTDGTNGVFRWNWLNKGVHYGNGAYEQSATPFYSSMALLDDERISRHYGDIYDCYPYSPSVRKIFFKGRSMDPYKLLVSLSKTRPSTTDLTGIFPTDEQRSLYQEYLRPRLLGSAAIIEEDEYEAVVGIRMVVMHYAFSRKFDPWIEDFFQYADRASALICNDCDRFESLLYELHLVHFLTRFVSVAAANGYRAHPSFARILSNTETRVKDLYLNRQREVVSTPGWNGVHLYTFKDYTEWKLNFYGVKLPLSPGSVTAH